MKSVRTIPKKRKQTVQQNDEELDDGASHQLFSGLPADVWSVILAYAYDSEIWFSDAPLSFRAGVVPLSGYWSLCRSLTEGLNLWIWSALSDEVKRTKGVLRLPGGSLTPAVSRWIPYVQKRAALALNRAPKEFLLSVRNVEGKVLSPTTESCFLLLMDNLESLTGPFLRCSNGSLPLQKVDLRNLSMLKVIGVDFLSFSSVEEILLPGCLERVGDRFLTGSRIKALDLSMTRITQVGDEFLKGTPLTNIQFPRTLRRVGHRFLSFTPTGVVDPPLSERTGLQPVATELHVDLSGTALESVGNHFLGDSSVQWIRLPRSLKKVGSYFLLKYSGKSLDLSNTSLESVDDEFLSHSQVEELLLPASLREVGPFFLDHFLGKQLDLSHTSLAHINHNFLNESNVEDLRLPPLLRSTSGAFLYRFRGRTLDLSGTILVDTGDSFLAESCVEELLLPPTLKIAGRFFLLQHQAKRLDMSKSFLEEVGSGFLAKSQLERVSLPRTLKVIGGEFLYRFPGKRLELFVPLLEKIGPWFLAESSVEELQLHLPRSLKVIETGFLFRFCGKRLDLSKTALEVVGDGFLRESGVEELLLPMRLKDQPRLTKSILAEFPTARFV
jgi:hypothetical protein